VDSFAGLLDRFYYTFTGESTSKSDRFDNLCSIIKILKTPLHIRDLGFESMLRDLNRKNPPDKNGRNLFFCWFIGLFV